MTFIIPLTDYWCRQDIYNLCFSLLTRTANLSSSPDNDILGMSSATLELQVEKVSFFTPFCLQALLVGFDIYIRSKTNVCRVKEKLRCSFLFFFLGRCGRLQMRCGEEDTVACLGKLLMQACFNLCFPDSDIIGSKKKKKTNWD